MISRSPIIIRTLSTKSNDIGQIFIKDHVQNLLKDITRYEESKIFARKPVRRLRSPKLMFMSNKMLEQYKADAYERAQARLQMPPVLEADRSEPEIISHDKDIVGYTKHRVMFVDIGPGYSDGNRLMSVREPDGTLRYPSHAERSRLNHIFFPKESRSIDPPKLFEPDNLRKILERGDYVHVLDRLCVQFEPNDPRYVDTVAQIYDHIDQKLHFDKLRSTRHFGPMSLYLAHNRKADNLILEMISKDKVEDAIKLIKVYYTCHSIPYEDGEDHLETLRNYSNYSCQKHAIDLSIQNLESKVRE